MAVVTVTGSSRTRDADGPRAGSARHTTRASKESSRLRRPARTTVPVTSITSPPSTGAVNYTSE